MLREDVCKNTGAVIRSGCWHRARLLCWSQAVLCLLRGILYCHITPLAIVFLIWAIKSRHKTAALVQSQHRKNGLLSLIYSYKISMRSARESCQSIALASLIKVLNCVKPCRIRDLLWLFIYTNKTYQTISKLWHYLILTFPSAKHLSSNKNTLATANEQPLYD